MNLSQENEEQSLLIIDSFALLFRGFFSKKQSGDGWDRLEDYKK